MFTFALLISLFMTDKKNLGFDLAEILEKFQLTDADSCKHLEDWLSAKYQLNEVSVASNHFHIAQAAGNCIASLM
jgi:hypothetical protein